MRERDLRIRHADDDGRYSARPRQRTARFRIGDRMPARVDRTRVALARRRAVDPADDARGVRRRALGAFHGTADRERATDRAEDPERRGHRWLLFDLPARLLARVPRVVAVRVVLAADREPAHRVAVPPVARRPRTRHAQGELGSGRGLLPVRRVRRDLVLLDTRTETAACRPCCRCQGDRGRTGHRARQDRRRRGARHNPVHAAPDPGPVPRRSR